MYVRSRGKVESTEILYFCERREGARYGSTGLMERETRLEAGVAGTRVHYLLILPVLVPVRPTQQRREIAGNWSPQNGDEVHALEGVS